MEHKAIEAEHILEHHGFNLEDYATMKAAKQREDNIKEMVEAMEGFDVIMNSLRRSRGFFDKQPNNVGSFVKSNVRAKAQKRKAKRKRGGPK